MPTVMHWVEELRQAARGAPWHGPSLATLLRTVDAATAAAHPLEGLHSVWEIVLHLQGWARECSRRLQGHPAALPPDGDWPAVTASNAAAWAAAQADLWAAHQELEDAVARLSEADLEEAVATLDGPAVRCEQLVSGLVQHDAYHGGQIALLKKACAARQAS
jgi:uncharacterized damage-inducible protein DinB